MYFELNLEEFFKKFGYKSNDIIINMLIIYNQEFDSVLIFKLDV